MEEFIHQPELREQNRDRGLSDLVMQLNKQYLKPPNFQRAFVWSETQVKGWIDSILTKKAVGVIVTYQLVGGGQIYLADGLQRLTATSRFIENPKLFGFEFNSNQAHIYCESFEITTQHRIYKDHQEAMSAFQKLNSGTGLTNLEFYKGELALINYGELIIDQVPKIIEKYETPLIYTRTKDRNTIHKAIRDCYGLFLQYISETDGMSFWDVSATTINPKRNTVENELSNYMKMRNFNRDDVNRLIGNFERFISEQVAEIRTLLKEAGGEGTYLSQTVMRWLLHLSIWRKNTKRAVPLYQKLVLDVFKYNMKTYGKIQSRFDLPGESPKISATMGLSAIGDLAKICRAFNSQLYEGRSRKRKKVAPGYHDSHIQPFSITGSDITIPESGLRNRSRGAKPMIQEVLL